MRVVLKYRHCDGNLCIKVTDDVAVSTEYIPLSGLIVPLVDLHFAVSQLGAIALRVPNSFLKTCVQPSLVAVSVTDIDLWFNSVQSRRSSNNSVFFMGANIIILGFYANKENEQYKNLGLSENASWNDIGSFC